MDNNHRERDMKIIKNSGKKIAISKLDRITRDTCCREGRFAREDGFARKVDPKARVSSCPSWNPPENKESRDVGKDEREGEGSNRGGN